MWVIVRVERTWLKRAAGELGGWVPVETRVTKPARKHKPVISQVPIFPSWVFVPYDGGNSLEVLREVTGVRGIVRYGRRLMLLRDEDIEELRRIEHELSKEPRVLPDAPMPYRIGDLVWVKGVLGGAPGEVIETRGTTQYLVLINKIVKVEVEGCLLALRSDIPSGTG